MDEKLFEIEKIKEIAQEVFTKLNDDLNEFYKKYIHLEKSFLMSSLLQGICIVHANKIYNIYCMISENDKKLFIESVKDSFNRILENMINIENIDINIKNDSIH